MERDKLGCKPLYYWEKDPLFCGGSVRELLEKGIPRRLSLSGLKSYLEYGCVCEPDTLIEGIKAVPPGCSVENMSQGAWKPDCEFLNWDLEQAQNAVTTTLDAVLAKVMAVNSPTPNVAAFLSGGIDSSAIVAIMRRLYKGEIRTYCVTHEDETTDERLWARRVAECNHVNHTELYLEGAYFSRHLADAIASYDQPSVDGINFWFASKMVVERGEKMILSGAGGDELFVGYGRFAKARALMRTASLLGPLRGTLVARGMGKFVNAFAPNEKWRKMGALLGWKGDPYFLSRRVLTDGQIRDILVDGLYEEMKQMPSYEDIWETAFGLSKKLDEINAISWKEIRTVLLSMFLRDGWQVSQAFNLEVISPLVDPEIVALMFKIQGALKCSNDYLKPLLVNAAGSGLPIECVTRKKQGFTLPFDRYFTGVLKDEIETFLGGESMLYKPKALQQLGRQYHSGKVTWTRVWLLFMLEKWCKENHVSL